MTRDAAARLVRRIAKAAGITTRIGPHRLRHSFITAPWTPASRSETCEKRRRTPIRAWPCATTEPDRHSTGTPPARHRHATGIVATFVAGASRGDTIHHRW